MIAGERGMTAEVTARAEPRLPGSRRVVLPDYDAPGWADVVADHTDAIVVDFAQPRIGEHFPTLARRLREPRRITFQVHGLRTLPVLLPFFWRHRSGNPRSRRWRNPSPSSSSAAAIWVASQPWRTAPMGPSYAAMINGLFDEMAPVDGETILDVGCGSGALDRLLARRFGGNNPITATDVNPFLLREAASLAAEDQLADRITFRQGNAERLPFPDASFDHAFTVTVFEECDADRALRELFRVVRPGGKVGVIVRAIDMPQWWHLELPEAVRRKANVPPQSCGPRGVADASLYRRMREAGFEQLTCFPTLVTFDRPDGPIWRYREDHVLSQLTEAETAIWHSATAAARQAGLLFMANPLHRAVGRKPRD